MKEKYMPQYPEVSAIKLDQDGGYYCRHVEAMTAEALQSKSDIAGQLGLRDREIDRLRAENKSLDRVKQVIIYKRRSVSDAYEQACRNDDSRMQAVCNAVTSLLNTIQEAMEAK